jgi:hypothetical protein
MRIYIIFDIFIYSRTQIINTYICYMFCTNNMSTLYPCVLHSFFLGTGRANNCEAVQSDTPATLSMQQLLHCILTVRTIVKIIPGEQVFLNYGPAFWKETKSTAKGNIYLYTCAYISAHI